MLFVMAAGTVFSQEMKSTSKNEICDEKVAIFPQGAETFKRMIEDNFRIKKVKSDSLATCMVKFIIERDGSISNISAEGENNSFNKEAIRAISKIQDKWIPAEINCQKVRYRFKVPLTFSYK